MGSTQRKYKKVFPLEILVTHPPGLSLRPFQMGGQKFFFDPYPISFHFWGASLKSYKNYLRRGEALETFDSDLKIQAPYGFFYAYSIKSIFPNFWGYRHIFIEEQATTFSEKGRGSEFFARVDNKWKWGSDSFLTPIWTLGEDTAHSKKPWNNPWGPLNANFGPILPRNIF